MGYNYWREKLPDEAVALALEFRTGKWDHLPQTKEGRLQLLEELRRRVPGRPDAEYSNALSEALQSTR